MAKTRKTKTARVQRYTTEDRVLSDISLPDPCPVSVEIDDDSVRLMVGNRDWEWNRKTNELTAAGLRKVRR
jgi:hypothetical protein